MLKRVDSTACIRIPAGFFLLASFFFLLPDLASQSRTPQDRIKVAIGTKNSEKETIARIISAVEKASLAYTGKGVSDSYEISLYTSEEKPPKTEIFDSGNALRIYLPPESNFLDDYDLHRALLTAFIKKNLRIRFAPEDDNPIPDWLASGLLWNLKAPRHQLVKIRPGIHSLVISGSLPGLRDLMGYPLKYSDGDSWILYSELCSILLVSLDREGADEQMKKNYLELASSGVSAFTSFRESFSKILQGRDSGFFVFSDSEIVKDENMDQLLDLWFKSLCTRAAVNIFYPAPAEFIVAKMDRMQTVHCEKAGNDGGEFTCTIAELPSKMQQIKNPDYVTARLERYLASILYMAPSPLHTSIRAIIDSFSPLRRGDQKKFSKAYQDAMQLFKKDSANMKSIEVYLDSQINPQIPPEQVFAPLTGAIDRYDSRRKELWPEIQAFLDSEGTR